MQHTALTPDLVLRAYTVGLFPMAERATDQDVFWVDPERRGIIPLETFHVPHSLKKVVRRGRFEVRVDHDFAGVMRGCAAPRAKAGETWINDQIIAVYCALNAQGFAHSVECWREDRLVGGLYGVSLRGAFFGESMFSRETDASKVALVHLVARLKRGGYTLLDTQFVTPHLARFGAIEISRRAYRKRLNGAMATEATFYGVLDVAGAALLQSMTQTS
jgi:leucyl/phenylalanyl-tRNA---protein transferase